MFAHTTDAVPVNAKPSHKVGALTPHHAELKEGGWCCIDPSIYRYNDAEFLPRPLGVDVASRAHHEHQYPYVSWNDSIVAGRAALVSVPTTAGQQDSSKDVRRQRFRPV